MGPDGRMSEGVCRPGAVPFAGLVFGGVAGDGARMSVFVSVGKYKGPCWPQAARLTALSARTITLTKIWGHLNMVKL
jgi:hypothetical protein